MSSKDLSSKAFSFKYQEFFKLGFIWWNLAAIGTGVPNDWDSLILKRWDR